MGFQPRPLNREELSPQVYKLTGPKAPLHLKKMAAKGMAPGLGPFDLVTALYQLHFSDTPELVTAADRSVSELPESLLEAVVENEELHVFVLDFLGRRIWNRPNLIRKVIVNSKVADETILFITPKMQEGEIEIIARNERRLLSCPSIIEAIYLNRNTRMSTANRCIEFAARNSLELSLPAYREMLKAIGMEPKEDDPIDQALLEEERNLKFRHAYEDIGEEDDDDDDGEAGESGKKSTGRLRIESLTVSEKIRLAITGNVFHRSVLLRDSNKMVALAAIKSPLVTEIEVVRMSKNPQTPEDVLRYISHRREWVKLYQVKANLVSNAKTPLDLALKMVSHLRQKELKSLSCSKNVSAALRAAAEARLKKSKR